MFKSEDVAKELFNNLSVNNPIFGIVPENDFINKAGKIIKSASFDTALTIEENAIEIANKLYDQLDKQLNLPSWVDIVAKDVFIPLACELIDAFIKNKLREGARNE